MEMLQRFVILVAVMLVAASCSTTSVSVDRDASDVENRTTDTSSDEFDTPDERIEFARHYVTFAGPVDDVHFDIVYFDNSDGRAPGPSDWDMKFVFVVDPATVDAWHADHVAVDELDTVWANKLVSLALEADPTADPAHFERSGSRVTIYGADGLVVQRVSTLG